MNKNTLFLCLVASLFLLSSARAQSGRWDFGVELQAYPTGFIPGLRIEREVGSKDAVHLRIGYQYIRHGDMGVHEDERGSGAGFTLGYRHYFKKARQGWLLGVRNDVWFNTLDWKDNIGTAAEISGTSKIVVFQPTLEGGYQFLIGGNRWVLTPTLGFGVEINVSTQGEPVGEGAILLGGLNLAYRIP